MKIYIEGYTGYYGKPRWFWHIVKPDVIGPAYARKASCRRGLERFIEDLRSGYEIVEGEMDEISSGGR